MATLADLETLLTQLGAPANLVAPLAAIPTAEDASGATGANPDSNGTTSVGWWQINSANWSWLSTVLGTPVNATTLQNQTLNAKAAIVLASQTPLGLRNWSTWNDYVAANAGATGLTQAQQSAATSIKSALGAIGAGNAASTPFGTAANTANTGATMNPFDPNFWKQVTATLTGQPQTPATTGTTGTSGQIIDFTPLIAYFTALGTDFQNWRKTWFSGGALIVLGLIVGIAFLAWVLAQSGGEEETDVTIAPAAQGAA
jgi:hypothetical protein